MNIKAELNLYLRKTQLRIESDSDEEDVKENIPSQSKEKSDSNAKVDDNSANSDPAKSKCDYSNTVDDPADIRQTDLNLPVPYRKTGSYVSLGKKLLFPIGF